LFRQPAPFKRFRVAVLATHFFVQERGEAAADTFCVDYVCLSLVPVRFAVKKAAMATVLGKFRTPAATNPWANHHADIFMLSTLGCRVAG
jgi:hypothetical protein